MGGRRSRLLVGVAVWRSLLGVGESWAPLLKALEEYPEVHARELGRLRKGKTGRFVFVRAYHGLGNREHALISSFGLALATRSALLVDWAGCAAAAECDILDPAAVSDLYERPRFEWTAATAGPHGKNTSSREMRVGDRTFEAAVRVSHGTQFLLLNEDLESRAPWNKGSFVVRTDNHFLRAVLCNEGVRRSGLFPPDALEAQRILEAALLRPSAAVRQRVAAHLTKKGCACAVGVHLRMARSPEWRADDVWPRLRDLLARHGADAHGKGLFIAADPASLDLKTALYDRARQAGLFVVGLHLEPNATRTTKDGILDALAENHILSSCDALVPTTMSTFFNIAAVRATARPAVRAVFACDEASLLTSDKTAQPTLLDGSAQPCLFDALCPDPNVGLPRGSNYYKHGQVENLLNVAAADDPDSEAPPPPRQRRDLLLRAGFGEA